MNWEVVPIEEQHIKSFHAGVDLVARERLYLSLLEAPPVDDTTTFVRNSIRNGLPAFVAVADGTVVGWCDVIPVPRPVHSHSGVLGMGVLPQWRRLGIGRSLLTRALGASRGFGLTRVELTVRRSNATAIALYKSNGFEVEGVKRKAVRVDGKYDDLLCMAIVYEEAA
jgi:ribosomal protein S18 acetylase RimI-like enzyme